LSKTKTQLKHRRVKTSAPTAEGTVFTATTSS